MPENSHRKFHFENLEIPFLNFMLKQTLSQTFQKYKQLHNIITFQYINLYCCGRGVQLAKNHDTEG